MGSIGHFLADDTVHLVKFFHEVRLVMETACRIDKKDIYMASHGCFYPIIDDAAGSAPMSPC